MKVLSVIVLVIFCASIAFALDTDLGKIPLTNNQVSHLPELKTENIKGFSYWPAEEKLIVVTLTPLSTNEIKQLIVDVNALPNTAIPVAKTEVEILQEKVTTLETKMTKAEENIGALKPK